MKKTSLYLDEDLADGLRRIASATGRPQAELVREALTQYVAKNKPRRTFLSAGIGDGGRPRGTSIADEDLDRRLSEILQEQRSEEGW